MKIINKEYLEETITIILYIHTYIVIIYKHINIIQLIKLFMCNFVLKVSVINKYISDYEVKVTFYKNKSCVKVLAIEN